MADEYENTHLPDYRSGHVRGYYPAANVLYKGIGHSPIRIYPENKVISNENDWELRTMSGYFCCDVLERGARSAVRTFGIMSYNKTGNDSISDGVGFSTLHLQLTARIFDGGSGNATSLLYSPLSTNYLQTAGHQNWKTVVITNALGPIRIEMREEKLTGEICRTAVDYALPELRYRNDISIMTDTYLLGASNINIIFYCSSWKKPEAGKAWLCIPLQTAAGDAALMECTAKQIYEHGALSIA